MRSTSALAVGLLLCASLLGLTSPTLGADPDGGSTEEARGFAGGDGSAMEPYRISNVSQLQNMSSNLSAHYELVNDIDASDTSNWNSGDGFVPVGNNTVPFNGSLDGRKFVISNLYIVNVRSNSGLFGDLATGGMVKNVGLENISVKSRISVGGLVGHNYGTIEFCYVTGNVTGNSREVGGLVGYNKGGTVKNCYSTATVTGDWGVGGLVGKYQYGNVENCYATGDVSGNKSIGGLIGFIYYSPVVNCYAQGDVYGREYAAGLIGRYLWSNVNSCYATGNITGDNVTGGLVAAFTGVAAVNSFWDVESSGLNSSSGGTGKTTFEMKIKKTFTDASWDFNFTWDIETWSTYPFFKVHFDRMNTPPVWDPIPVLTAVEDVPVTIDFSPYIIDPDDVRSNLRLNCSSPFMMGNISGLSVTFLFGEGITEADITLVVWDLWNSTSVQVLFEIEPVDDAMVRDDPIEYHAVEGVPLTVDLSANISDVDSDIYAITFDSTSEYATFDGLNLTVILPGGSPVMEIDVFYRVGPMEIHFSVTFWVEQVNEAPVFDEDPPVTIYEDEEFAYTFLVSDGDDDPLVFDITNVPSQFHQRGYDVWWTPGQDDVGTYNITVSIKDPMDEEAVIYWLLEVVAVNDAPMIDHVSPLELMVTEGVPYQVDMGPWLSDEDHDISQLALAEDSEMATVDGHVVTILCPVEGSVSEETFTVTVSDLEAASASIDIVLRIMFSAEGMSTTDLEEDVYSAHYLGLERDGDEIGDMWGSNADNTNLDILGLDMSIDDEQGTVIVTMQMAGPINISEGDRCSLAFVNLSHQQPLGGLLDPDGLTEPVFDMDFVDAEDMLFICHASYHYRGTEFFSGPDIPIVGGIEGNTITFTIQQQDLFALGIDGGSVFGLFGFAYRLEASMDTPDWYLDVTWDTAGIGAGGMPDGFNTVTFTQEDFSALNYEEAKKDPYTLFLEGSIAYSTVAIANGKWGGYPHMDIVSLKAIYDEASGIVTITFTTRSEIAWDDEHQLWISFVTKDHMQPTTLWDHESLDLSAWMDFVDADESYIHFYLVEDTIFNTGLQAGSSPRMENLDFDLRGNVLELTMDANELRRMGLRSGSGFDLYAYMNIMNTTLTGGNSYEQRITFDAIGRGALDKPAGASNDDGDGDGLNLAGLAVCVVMVLILVLVIVGAVMGVSRSRKRKKEAANLQNQPWVQQQSQMGQQEARGLNAFLDKDQHQQQPQGIEPSIPEGPPEVLAPMDGPKEVDPGPTTVPEIQESMETEVNPVVTMAPLGSDTAEPAVLEEDPEQFKLDSLKRKYQNAISQLPYGIPSGELKDREWDDLAGALATGEKSMTPDGIETTQIDGRWYYSDVKDSGSFLKEHGAKKEPKVKEVSVTDDKTELLAKLEERFIIGEISEETYRELTDKYNEE